MDGLTPASRKVFYNGNIVLPDRLLEAGIVVCEGEQIVSVAAAGDIPTQAGSNAAISDPAGAQRDDELIDLRGAYLAPGFIDLHVHGGAGHDFMDGSEEAIAAACRAHLSHGTTTIFPTTTTGSPAQLHAMLEACGRTSRKASGARIAGVHLYGPYFAEDKVGCHAASGRREPLASEYADYFATGLVRIATCAAELPGATAFYQAAAEAGCFITCGHSNASWSEMEIAFANGARHVDHFWCAMSSVPSLRQRFNVPMQASMAEFVLLNAQMSTEVIADGQHLAPELLEFAYRMLGSERLCLVTDCNRALDYPPGNYRFGNHTDGTMLYSDGKVGWSADRSSLASSIVGMDHMIRQMLCDTTADLPTVVRMASLTPATRLGMEAACGSIEVNKQADFVVLDKTLNVQRVYVAGECQFTAEPVV
ncbi:N-acetylglucosamine-6-phosphate deacetylase [Planctomycetaceae bacterium SH139]